MLLKKIHTYLQLIRFPNLFTAMADSFAGYLIVFNKLKPAVLISLLFTSACIYAAGCVLNDFCDIKKDNQERPERPIPSGRVSRTEAIFLFSVLSAVSLLLSACVGTLSLVVCALLIVLIIIYNFITKERPISGPINMAILRALNLYLGMTVAIKYPILGTLFLIITFVYVLSVTILSDYEMTGEPGKKIWLVNVGFILVLCLPLLLSLTGSIRIDSLIFLALLLLFSGPMFIKAVMNLKPVNIGKAIKYLVLGIPLLDATYVAGIQGWGYAVPVAMCTLISIIFARYFYVT